MRKFLGVFLLLVLTLTAVEAKQEIMVSAAMSLKDVFTELGHSFESSHQDVQVVFNFASSGQLRMQIEQGAPVDIFASASQQDMDGLAAKDLILKDTRKDFAKNVLVLIAPIDAKIELKDVEGLKKETVKLIGIGNPDTVPAGKYAKETLVFYKTFEPVKNKLVFGENVRQVLDYVSRGEVDAGFVYLSDTKGTKNIRVLLSVSAEAHAPIIYPLAVIKNSTNAALARKFIAFIIDKKNQMVFEKYGFK